VGKIIIYIDMDDVLCDFMGEFKRKFKDGTLNFPQGKIGFFENLPPIKDAIESVNKLRTNEAYDVWVLTAPSTMNPHSYTEKRIWIEKYFDYDFTNKLILSPNKGLLKGDILIDDHSSGKGQENFEGELMQFGSEEYPDWETIMERLK